MHKLEEVNNFIMIVVCSNDCIWILGMLSTKASTVEIVILKFFQNVIKSCGMVGMHYFESRD